MAFHMEPSSSPRREPDRRSRLALAAATALATALLAGACGGGGSAGSSPSSTTTPAPAARIDPTSKGVITEPVNKARSTVDSLNERQPQPPGE